LSHCGCCCCPRGELEGRSGGPRAAGAAARAERGPSRGCCAGPCGRLRELTGVPAPGPPAAVPCPSGPGGVRVVEEAVGSASLILRSPPLFWASEAAGRLVP
jgi:hypothetical protein